MVRFRILTLFFSIQDIHTEVIRSTQYMLSQLLIQLTGNIQLPACLRIISYIRQLDVFKEVELRIKFLEVCSMVFMIIYFFILSPVALLH